MENSADWKRELGAFLEEKRRDKMEERRQEAEQFLRAVVVPAFQELKSELERHGRMVFIREVSSSASLKVTHQGEEEVTYSVHIRTFTDRTEPYPSIRYRERRGVRYVTLEGAFGTAGQPVATADISKEDVIRNFLFYYMRYTREV